MTNINSYTVPVDDEGILTIPQDLLDQLGWKPGDKLEWLVNPDESFTLRKIE